MNYICHTALKQIPSKPFQLSDPAVVEQATELCSLTAIVQNFADNVCTYVQPQSFQSGFDSLDLNFN